MWKALVAGAIIAFLQWWAVSQSKSSTAAIAILFIPVYAGVAMLGVWLAERAKKPWRYVLYAPAGLISIWILKSGFDIRNYEFAREVKHQERFTEIQKRRQEITATLARYQGREHKAIDEMIESHPDDPLYIEAAFSFEAMSIERLKKLSLEGKYDLYVISHPKVTSELIATIYDKAKQKGVLVSRLAGNPKTPKRILIDIYRQRQSFIDLEEVLLRNPSLPSEIRESLLEEKAIKEKSSR